MLTGQTWQVEVVSRATAHWVRYKLHGSFLMSDVHNRAGRWSALSGCNLNPTKHTTLAKCNTGCRQESSCSNTSSQIPKESFKIWFCFYAPARKLESGNEIQRLRVPISTLYTTGVPGLVQNSLRDRFLAVCLAHLPSSSKNFATKASSNPDFVFSRIGVFNSLFPRHCPHFFFFLHHKQLFLSTSTTEETWLHEEQKKDYQNTGAAQLPSVQRDFKVDFFFFTLLGISKKCPDMWGIRESAFSHAEDWPFCKRMKLLFYCGTADSN